MKSSTIRRSTLSKETMQVIENLVESEGVTMDREDMYEQEGINTPDEYVRPHKENEPSIINKAQEIDMLWQNFKNLQINTQSPTAYVLFGFIAGVLTTLIISFCIVPFFSTENIKTNTPKADVVETNAENYEQTAEENNVNSETAEQVQAKAPADYSGSPTYKIQNGDTIEKIIIKHYGSYTPERAEAIKKANNLSNLDRISIDQVLIMPEE